MAILKHCINILVFLAIIMVSFSLLDYLLFDPLILTFENESGQTISSIGIDAACHIETINSLKNGESTSVSHPTRRLTRTSIANHVCAGQSDLEISIRNWYDHF